jgi:hypothetical protein
LTLPARSLSVHGVAWIEDLYFSVELWTDERLEEVVARCSRPDLARAAYQLARTIYPKRTVMLCRQAQILERSDRPS